MIPQLFRLIEIRYSPTGFGGREAPRLRVNVIVDEAGVHAEAAHHQNDVAA